MAYIFQSTYYLKQDVYSYTYHLSGYPWVFVLKRIIWWCRVSTTICFQVNNVRETWDPPGNNAIGSISFFLSWQKWCVRQDIIYCYILYGFSLSGETSPTHKHRGKAVFSDPFTYLFFWQRDFLYFYIFFFSIVPRDRIII